MPTRDTAWPAGTPCWLDYGAADIDAAKAFYADLLGWTYTGGEPEYGGYLNAHRNDKKAAGMAPQQDPDDPPRWTLYFASDDIQATADKVASAGGTVVTPPMDVSPQGWMMIARDPQGNPFGVWQAGLHTGTEVFNEPGSLVWEEAAVDDLPAAQAFYGEVFGFTYTEIENAGGYGTFATDGDPLGGIGGSQPGAPKGWTVCFSVSSTDDAVAKVERAGGKVTMAAQDTPYGRFAVVADQWGAGFSVMQELKG